MAQVGYWFDRSQSACGAQSSVKLGGGRFSGQPVALAAQPEPNALHFEFKMTLNTKMRHYE
eukprot:scaffold6495_cov155-Skeletonema_marinoi.AAC.1